MSVENEEFDAGVQPSEDKVAYEATTARVTTHLIPKVAFVIARVVLVLIIAYALFASIWVDWRWLPTAGLLAILLYVVALVDEHYDNVIAYFTRHN